MILRSITWPSTVPPVRSTAHAIQGGLLRGKSLIDAFADWGQTYSNLVYFSACSVFAEPDGIGFAREFFDTSKCRAVIGYGKDVDWLEGMLIDLLFLHRFYSHPEPWTHLREIHREVKKAFPRAIALGYQIHLAE